MDDYGVVTEPGTVRIQRALPGPMSGSGTTSPSLNKRGTWLAKGAMEPHVGGRVGLHFRNSELSAEFEAPPEKYRDHDPWGRDDFGRVTAWEPPRRLAYTWNGNSEVTFELTPEGCRRAPRAHAPAAAEPRRDAERRRRLACASGHPRRPAAWPRAAPVRSYAPAAREPDQSGTLRCGWGEKDIAARISADVRAGGPSLSWRMESHAHAAATKMSAMPLSPSATRTMKASSTSGCGPPGSSAGRPARRARPSARTASSSRTRSRRCSRPTARAQRCQPLSHPSETSDVVRLLVDAVEREPDKRWRDADFDALDMHASTARRLFEARFGMTFVQYARARRLGAAFKAIRAGERVIMAQLDAGYQSGSGFRHAFATIMGAPPGSGAARALFAAWLDTPLGPMTAIGDQQALYLLEYVDRPGLERQIERLRARTKAGIVPGRTGPIARIETELAAYFGGRLTRFETPLARLGSPFQHAVWDALLAIPPGDDMQLCGTGARDRQAPGRASGRPGQRCQSAGHHRPLPPRHQRRWRARRLWRRRGAQALAPRA